MLTLRCIEAAAEKSAADAARLFQVHRATISRLVARQHAVQTNQKPAVVPPLIPKKSAKKRWAVCWGKCSLKIF